MANIEEFKMLDDWRVAVQETEKVPVVGRHVFNQKLYEVARKRGMNTKLIPQDRYTHFIDEIKQIKINGKKNSLDARRDKKYAVIEMPNGEERLFYKPALAKNIRLMMITLEETYDIIHKCHLKLNHGGRSRMIAELRKTYYNVTTESLYLYLSMCQACWNKSGKIKMLRNITSGTVIASKESEEKSDAQDVDDGDSVNDFTNDDLLESSLIIFEDEPNNVMNESAQKYPELYSRGQMDLLSVTNEANEEYKYLMVYRNFATKFIHLKALKGVNVEEAAESLMDIFLVFGAPNVLQSKNGVAVLKPICRRVSALCPDVKVVYSEKMFPRSAFQGKSNEDILRKLNEWLVRTQNAKWQNGVKYIQHSLNTTFNEILCRTPSELLFGKNPSKGLASFLSPNVYEALFSEAELLAELESQNERNVTKTSVIQLSESIVLPGEIKLEVESISENDSNDIKFD